MRMLVLGAGRMGLGAVFDLASQDDVTGVTVADMDAEKAREVAGRVGEKAVPVTLDVTDHEAVVELMRGHVATLSCVVYRLNERLARAAIEAGSHFCDLGGNNSVVDAELALDALARARGVNVIPDCGLAPGMVSLLVAYAAAKFDSTSDIRIRVGGLPLEPKPPLNYQIVFSVEGLINEYVEDARVIRDGEIRTVPSMTEIEHLRFPEPFGRMEAFQTSGGTSTLPETFKGKVRNLDYKTIRYPGHCEKFRTMIDLGLCSSEPLEVDGASVIPRRVFGESLLRNLPGEGPDVVLVRVEVEGTRGSGQEMIRLDIIDRYDEVTGLTAMMRTTAFPAAIVALMMARGQTTRKGAHPQERCLPPDVFMRELALRNIEVRESWH